VDPEDVIDDLVESFEELLEIVVEEGKDRPYYREVANRATERLAAWRESQIPTSPSAPITACTCPSGIQFFSPSGHVPECPRHAVYIAELQS
jgi:hypothetical protein